MSRSIWKPKNINFDIINHVTDYKILDRTKSIKLITSYYNLRNTTIVPNLVGLSVLVHKGKYYEKISITSDMIGTKLGEYAYTKKMGLNIHKNILVKKQNKKLLKIKKFMIDVTKEKENKWDI